MTYIRISGKFSMSQDEIQGLPIPSAGIKVGVPSIVFVEDSYIEIRFGLSG